MVAVDIKFKGPFKFVGDTTVLNSYVRPDIIDAYIQIEENTYPIQQNWLSLMVSCEYIYIYHSFNYMIGNEIIRGRWYDTHFPINLFSKIVDDTFIIPLDGINIGLTFNSSVLKRLKETVNSLNKNCRQS